MPRSRRSTLLRDDTGAGSLEFIVAGLVLLVPIVYLVVALGQIQHASLGAESAARHIARAIAQAPDADAANAAAERTAESIAAQYGIDGERMRLSVGCSSGTGGAADGACPRAGAVVRVSVEASVPLPLVPPVLDLREATAVHVSADAVQSVSRLWSEQ